MDSAGGKSDKYPMVKSIYVFTNSSLGGKCSGLFKFKVQVSRCVWGVGSFVVKRDTFLTLLRPIQTFYDRRLIPQIRSVAACCCVLGGSNFLLVIPHDEGKLLLSPNEICEYVYFMEPYDLDLLSTERETLPPYSFDLKTKEIIELPQFPQARKTRPILMVIGHRVFAMSSSTSSSPLFEVPDPCFESFDLDKNIWSKLDCPTPFHNNEPSSYVVGVIGFAVLEEEEGGYILVYVEFLTCCQMYSYNICSGTWKPVALQHQPQSDSDQRRPFLYDQAVVVGNDIYTFFPDDKKLFVFSYNTVNYATTTTTNSDISLGLANEVEGLKFKKKHFLDHSFVYRRTGAVVKVDDQMLCILVTLFPTGHFIQDVLVTFVELLADAKCTTLNSFVCTLSAGDREELPGQTIKSCFVLDEPEKKNVLPGDVDYETSMEEAECNWDAGEWWVM